MKTIIIAAMLALTTNSFAHTIIGTPVLKGSIKTKIMVNNINTTCKVKVEKVQNLMLEDSYGNPAYNVRINIDLEGRDSERRLAVDFDQDFWIHNLFSVGNKTEVRDFEYASTQGVRMNIDQNGRIINVSFPFNGRAITCSFR